MKMKQIKTFKEWIELKKMSIRKDGKDGNVGKNGKDGQTKNYGKD